MDSIDKAVKAIKNNFPDFEFKSIYFAGEGADFWTYFVNGKYIFRFPKYQFVSGNVLEKEILLLPEISKAISLEIPSFQYIGKAENDFLFVGYKKIEGNPLEKELFSTFDLSLKIKIIKQLVNFLIEVHSFKIDKTNNYKIKYRDVKNIYTNYFEKIKLNLFEKIENPQRNLITSLFQNFLSNEKNFDCEPSLIHGNLKPEHVFFDPVKQEIVGVIDFGAAEINDPDFELRYLYWFESKNSEFLKIFLEYYPHKNTQQLLEKLKFLKLCNTYINYVIEDERRL